MEVLENGAIGIDTDGDDDPVHRSAITGPPKGLGAGAPGLVGVYTCQ